MKTLRQLALVADLVAFAVVSLGSWTRIHAAGLTCPDWPTCHGRLVPAMAGGTLWEWMHRLLALLLAPLIVAIAVRAYRERLRSALLLPTAALIVALFLVQVGLGAATVDLDNTPISVVLHWGTAMALIAAILALAIFAGDEPGELRSSRGRASMLHVAALGTTVAVAFLTMCIGAYVSSSGAGLACLSIPGCAGNVVVYTPGQIVQMLHRLSAAGTLLCATVAFALIWMKPHAQRVRLWTGIGFSLVFIQVILGLLNVALRLPTDLREVHAVNAALVFLAFVSATAFALLDAPPAAQAREIR